MITIEHADVKSRSVRSVSLKETPVVCPVEKDDLKILYKQICMIKPQTMTVLRLTFRRVPNLFSMKPWKTVFLSLPPKPVPSFAGIHKNSPAQVTNGSANRARPSAKFVIAILTKKLARSPLSSHNSCIWSQFTSDSGAWTASSFISSESRQSVLFPKNWIPSGGNNTAQSSPFLSQNLGMPRSVLDDSVKPSSTASGFSVSRNAYKSTIGNAQLQPGSAPSGGAAKNLISGQICFTASLLKSKSGSRGTSWSQIMLISS
mmetsp:Transcript_13937/g.23159  ORF Transcript_13937/g.23159 Transcript_13937/m.23159 type:complete len:260 (+) Transcript_13937:259-1038(+)